MIVSALAPDELRHRLRAGALRIRIGPVAAAVTSPFRAVATAIETHYAQHELVADDEFVDFRVSVRNGSAARRYVRPQAIFSFDGRQPFKPLPASQAFPLLEWGLNWCVSTECHQYLIVHAAVVEAHGRALILPAPPGSGKSTLCAALVARGWRLLSDELALIDLETRRLTPIPRPISLKNESISAVSRFWPEASLGSPVHGTIKGTVAHASPPRSSVVLAGRSAPAGWIVIPQYRSGVTTSLTTLSKASAFMQLVENAFNYSVHGRVGFEVMADLVAGSECLRFQYAGSLDEAIPLFDRLPATG